MNCPACGIEMESLVEGIYQCPKCKKIIKEKEEVVEKEEKEGREGEFQDGEFFHNNASINKKYEICEKGITISKSKKRWIAVLICHSAYLKSERYIRISWWKKSFYKHGGMFKIHEKAVLHNVIDALEKIDEKFDDFWGWHGKFGKQSAKTEEQLLKERKLDIIKYRIIENRTCPKCQNKMNKSKTHYECPKCGEIVILEGYNQPIFNISSSDIELDFTTNFPINYYLPQAGITVKWLMGEWKALVVIYSKENPNKKWLRFYWWVRDLQNLIKYGHKEIGENVQLGWKAKKGVSSPNLYNKEKVKPIIDALKLAGEELNW
ncbi:MAG: hypothetical protein ACOC44_08510 [Promethearchaeia archaeon]